MTMFIESQAERWNARAAISIALALAGTASAGITFSHDQAAWEGEVGVTTYIDFGIVPFGGFVTEQFAGLGVHFPDGNDWRTEVSYLGGPWVPALWSTPFVKPPPDPLNNITIEFDLPQKALAWDVTEVGLSVSFFSAENLLQTVVTGSAAPTGFTGYLSDQEFNRVVVNAYPIANAVFISNFQFSSIPAPGGILLLCGALVTRRRRRM